MGESLLPHDDPDGDDHASPHTDDSGAGRPDDSEPACCIVGLGASAGGLEALQRFFDHVPDDSNLAFVIVQHLSPAHKSLMVDLLSRHTRMQVVQAEDGVRVAGNTVYLLPPGKTLTVENRRLRLSAKELASGITLPIDIFFTSLAQDQGSLAIGVVLSGTGSDGSRGLLAIKSAGGFTAVQEPASAQFDGMPRSAIATGQIDVVATADDLPDRIARHARDALDRNQPLDRQPSDGRPDPLAQIIGSIRSATGVDFSHYKLATLMRRIERRMHAVGCDRIEDYAALLRRNTGEAVTLYKEMLIGVTRFFRDDQAFRAVADRVIPAILSGRSPNEQIRVWVCGCATGEEAYSLAMLFSEAMERSGRTIDVKIFATDIDQDSIEFASVGAYPAAIADDVSAERLARFFSRQGDSYVITREIRRMVVCAVHNIMRDPPFTKIDLVSCRNLLIYMDAPLQRKVLGLFQYALRQGGHLFLGTSETLGELGTEFHSVDSRSKIFQSLRVGSLRLSRQLVPQIPHPPRGPDASLLPDDGPAVDDAIGALLKLYAPPTLLVNEQFNILHVFGDASPFLRVPPGDATLNAARLLPSSVGMVVGTALTRCFRSGEEFALANIPVKDREGLTAISLRIKPITSRKTGKRHALVLLEPVTTQQALVSSDFDITADTAERIRGLEQELMSRGENLQAAIEELETTNEELQATNEELLASNEELQSTNEELQSVNEELYSVNSEYQQKVEELTDITNDLDNLLRSTEIGTIFLDGDMVIRRFTPAAATFINIIPRDIGRSIGHLSTNIDYPDFLEDIRSVFASHKTVERHVRVRDGRWIQTRILPYLTDKNLPAGVVVTFVNVTVAKDAEQRLQRVINSLPEHIAVLDGEGTITMVNDAWNRFATTNGAPALERCGIGTNYLDVCAAVPGDAVAAAVREGLSRLLSGDDKPFYIEYPCHSQTEERWFLMHAVRLNDEQNAGAVISHIDITHRMQTENQLNGDQQKQRPQ